MLTSSLQNLGCKGRYIQPTYIQLIMKCQSKLQKSSICTRLPYVQLFQFKQMGYPNMMELTVWTWTREIQVWQRPKF